MLREIFPSIMLLMTAKYLSRLTESGCEPTQYHPASPRRILVVEDDRDFRQITAEVLIDAGYQVDVVADGAAAWTALQLSRFALLITDQFLPKMTGLGLLREIHRARMTLPIIMATGFLPIREFARHPFLRAAHLLFKPYSFEKLLFVVNELLPATIRTGDYFPATVASGSGTPIAARLATPMRREIPSYSYAGITS